ncbi:glycosyltransferase [Methanobacterium formicicum]|uniref:Glycosyltransferase n=1 Tax=Methanobacterium formicicum TaxID=2162 RepID=A0A090I145_METFO|nr:glycosyltransferase [Methanobacterium formicicum]MDH2659141.1 glycosyltransferase [Methanobacterium formicicum]CEA12618.1 hypothetical protein DSM1535_0254 [Methanobacterium formicicum]
METIESNKSLKILQVISTPPFAWSTGGCARVSFDLSKELVKRGHDVTILTTNMLEPNQRYSKKDIEHIDGIRFIRFDYVSDKLAWKYKIYLSLGIINYLKNHVMEYDIVHLQDLISIHAICTAKYCQKFNVPYVSSAHGSLNWLFERKIINTLYNKFFASYILENASRLIALNNTELSLYEKFGLNKKKVQIIPNGISLVKEDILQKKGLFRIKYQINEDQNIILYLGRIHESKGIDLLIRAFSDLKTSVNKSKLVIVGPDDGFMPKIETLVKKLKIKNDVIFTGPLYGDEKKMAYLDADIFVTPSFTGFPITFLEACSLKTPIITTKNADTLNWIDYQVGFVVPYTQKDLKDAMFNILNDKNLENTFADNCVEMVKKRFTWNIIAENLEKLYLDIIISRGSI